MKFGERVTGLKALVLCRIIDVLMDKTRTSFVELGGNMMPKVYKKYIYNYVSYKFSMLLHYYPALLLRFTVIDT
jgi:hypothetical protein